MKKRLKNPVLEHYRILYARSDRSQKKSILSTLEEEFGYSRKAAIRLLNGYNKDTYGLPRPGRKATYDSPEFIMVLKRIWFASDQMCSKKLKAAIPLWLEHYESTYEILSEKIKQQLLTISAPSIDRVLKPIRPHYPLKGLSGTRPGSLLKTQIPIKTDHWDVTMPGFMEADTVAHCGNTLAGSFIWSLTLTDIYSGWTEIRAVWNKGSEGVLAQVHDIEKILPFLLLGFDCDNGSEFLNHHFYQYFTEKKPPVQFTRSRPYRKNDNAHVEQKNWTHVRQLFGYDRLDNPILVELMNQIYANEWSLLQNYFCPNMKLISKTKINSKYTKKYDKPLTPYQRLMNSEHVTPENKEKLSDIFHQLNPFKLKKDLEHKLKAISQHIKLIKIKRG